MLRKWFGRERGGGWRRGTGKGASVPAPLRASSGWKSERFPHDSNGKRSTPSASWGHFDSYMLPLPSPDPPLFPNTRQWLLIGGQFVKSKQQRCTGEGSGLICWRFRFGWCVLGWLCCALSSPVWCFSWDKADSEYDPGWPLCWPTHCPLHSHGIPLSLI